MFMLFMRRIYKTKRTYLYVCYMFSFHDEFIRKKYLKGLIDGGDVASHYRLTLCTRFSIKTGLRSRMGWRLRRLYTGFGQYEPNIIYKTKITYNTHKMSINVYGTFKKTAIHRERRGRQILY